MEQIVQLFYDTVHTVNASDYSQQQLDVWATGEIDYEKWNASFLEHLTYVATENDMIVGFGDIDDTGYLDRLYVHRDFQGRGIATALCDRLEKEACVERIEVHSSITARPFFESRGYRVIRSQEVERHGILLKNYIMVKNL